MSYFETRARADGTPYVALKEDHPEWVYDAVYEAHDDEAPNDWRYMMCERIFEAFADDYDPRSDDHHELVDSLVTIWNVERAQWLCDEVTRAEYVDRAIDDLGIESRDIFELLAYGMYVCIEQMVRVIAQAIVENEEGGL